MVGMLDFRYKGTLGLYKKKIHQKAQISRENPQCAYVVMDLRYSILILCGNEHLISRFHVAS